LPPFTFDCNEPSTLAIVVGSPEYRCMRSRVCFHSLRNSTQELVRGKHAWHGAVGVSRWFMMYRDRRWGIVLFFLSFFISIFVSFIFFFHLEVCKSIFRKRFWNLFLKTNHGSIFEPYDVEMGIVYDELIIILSYLDSWRV
jgi:hypothetical protein